jgi:hypothetical protein
MPSARSSRVGRLPSGMASGAPGGVSVTGMVTRGPGGGFVVTTSSSARAATPPDSSTGPTRRRTLPPGEVADLPPRNVPRRTGPSTSA